MNTNDTNDEFLNFHSEFARESLLMNLKNWINGMEENGTSDYRVIAIQKRFYEDVRSSRNDNTYWCTEDAEKEKRRNNKRPTLDHYNNPRLVCRLIMNDHKHILHDKELFKEIFLDCRKVIGVTPAQNNMVKYTVNTDINSIKSSYNDFGCWIYYNPIERKSSTRDKFPLKFIDILT